MLCVPTFENIPLLELLGRGSEGESPDELGPDDVPLVFPLLLGDLVQDVAVYQLLLPRPLLQLHGQRLLPRQLSRQPV